MNQLMAAFVLALVLLPGIARAEAMLPPSTTAELQQQLHKIMDGA